MRSCLLRLLLILLLAGAVLWVSLPLAASALARGAVVAAGLDGESVEVTVLANPPLKLLLLEADGIRIRSGRGTWRGIVFARLDATVTTARVGGSAGAIAARLDGVELPGEGGVHLQVGMVDVSGRLESADVVVRLSRAEVEVAVRQALPPDLRALAGTITLSPPDGVRIAAPGGEVFARLALTPDGSLGLRVEVPGQPAITATVFRPDVAVPIRLRGVTMDGSSVELRGTLDARDLGF